jgi:hypothetical protein
MVEQILSEMGKGGDKGADDGSSGSGKDDLELLMEDFISAVKSGDAAKAASSFRLAFGAQQLEASEPPPTDSPPPDMMMGPGPADMPMPPGKG